MLKEKIKKNWIIIFLVLISLTPVVWFWGKPGVLINGVDTNFPLNPLIWFQRRLFVWDDISNAGSDFASSTAGLIFHLVQVIPYTLGLGLAGTELFSLIFWFAAIVFSSYIFAKSVFKESILSQVVFVVFYSFNIYLFNTWENVKVANLSLVAAIPLSLYVLRSLFNREIGYVKAFIVSVVTGVLVSGSGINPAYFVSFFLLIGIFFLAHFFVDFKKKNFWHKIKSFIFVISVIVVVNSFWILPTLHFIATSISPQGSIEKVGFVNWLGSLSENTSLVNVLRLQGAWDWYAFDAVTGVPLYIPYALNYFYKLPFIFFSFWVVSLVLASFILRSKMESRNSPLYLSFGLMLIIGVFLGAGLHEPTGVMLGWLANHLPFFSLFRSPWYIFTPLVTISFSGLVSLLFLSLRERVTQGSGRVALFIFFLILIGGNLLYSYPLLTGKIFRPQRKDGFYVTFPDYIFGAGDWLNRQDEGRVIGYPDDEIENFDWGYRGIDSVLSLLSNKELLFSPLNLRESPLPRLINEFYSSLKKGETESAMSVAGKLNMRYLLIKGDELSLAPKPSDTFSWVNSKVFGRWTIYTLPGDQPKIYTPSEFFFFYPWEKAPLGVGVLKKNQELVNPEDSVVNKIPAINRLGGNVVVADNSQLKDFKNFSLSASNLANRLVLRDPSKVEFSFYIPKDGEYAPLLEKYGLEKIGLNSYGTLTFSLDGKESSWEMDNFSDSFVRFKKVFLIKGEHKLTLPLKNNNLVLGSDFEKGSAFSKSGLDTDKAFYEIVNSDKGKYLSILNLGKGDVSADFVVPDFDPLIPYLIQLRYRQVYGNNATVLAGQSTKTTLVKTQVERLPDYPEWNNFSFYYEPVKTESQMKVLLSSPFTKDPLGTKVLYDDLAVYKVFSNNLFFVQEGLSFPPVPKISFQKISPADYRIDVSDIKGPHVIVFSENYSKDWKIRGIKGKPLHFSINSFANAWYVEGGKDHYSAEIYYLPQRFFDIGLTISIASILLATALLIRGLILYVKGF